MENNRDKPSLNPLFTHNCRSCGRWNLLELSQLGTLVKCGHCGRPDTARDPENESAALLDALKDHAELAVLPTDDQEHVSAFRLPR